MLDRASPHALYRQIADDLTEAIETRYQAGERLPSESQLVENYGVSRITVRQALEFLEEQGLVVRKQGKGTFVSTPRIRQDLRQLGGFYPALLSQGVRPDARLMEFGLVESTPRIQSKLCTTEREVLLCSRFYRVDGRPLSVARSYFHPSLITVLTREMAERHTTNTLLTKFAGFDISRVELAIRVQPASTETARLLEVPPSTGLLVLDRLTYSPSPEPGGPDIPRKFSMLYLRSDLYEFSMAFNGEVSLTDGIQVIEQFE
jgi:GntR family transcriptional regulator